MNPSLFSRVKPIFSPLAAIAAALFVGAGLILLGGKKPITAYTVLFSESLTNYYGIIGNTLTKMAPLLLAGLGVQVALKAGQFNIGAEGQIYLGGLGSTLVGLSFPGLPSVIHLPLALLAGFVFGALWGLISGYLKVVRGFNEVIATLLMNYIALKLVGYLVENPLMEPGVSTAYSPLLQKTP